MTVRPRVYIDACVLILAAKASEDEVATRAFQELDREGVEFVYSSIVELEVLVQPLRNGLEDEVEFYRTFMGQSTKAPCAEAEQQAALAMRVESAGLGLADALHLSVAAAAGVSEFVTAEGPTKPMVANPPESIRPMEVRTIRIPA